MTWILQNSNPPPTGIFWGPPRSLWQESQSQSLGFCLTSCVCEGSWRLSKGMPGWVQADVSSHHHQACLHISLPFTALRFWNPRVCWDLQSVDPHVGAGGGEPAEPGAPCSALGDCSREQKLMPGQRGQLQAWGLHKRGRTNQLEQERLEKVQSGRGGQGAEPVRGNPSGCWDPLSIRCQTL